MRSGCALSTTTSPTTKSAGFQYSWLSSRRSLPFFMKVPPSTPLLRILGSYTAISPSSRYSVMRNTRSALMGSSVTSLASSRRVAPVPLLISAFMSVLGRLGMSDFQDSMVSSSRPKPGCGGTGSSGRGEGGSTTGTAAAFWSRPRCSMYHCCVKGSQSAMSQWRPKMLSVRPTTKSSSLK